MRALIVSAAVLLSLSGFAADPTSTKLPEDIAPEAKHYLYCPLSGPIVYTVIQEGEIIVQEFYQNADLTKLEGVILMGRCVVKARL